MTKAKTKFINEISPFENFQMQRNYIKGKKYINSLSYNNMLTDSATGEIVSTTAGENSGVLQLEGCYIDVERKCSILKKALPEAEKIGMINPILAAIMKEVSNSRNDYFKPDFSEIAETTLRIGLKKLKDAKWIASRTTDTYWVNLEKLTGANRNKLKEKAEKRIQDRIKDAAILDAKNTIRKAMEPPNLAVLTPF